MEHFEGLCNVRLILNLRGGFDESRINNKKLMQVYTLNFQFFFFLFSGFMKAAQLKNAT